VHCDKGTANDEFLLTIYNENFQIIIGGIMRFMTIYKLIIVFTVFLLLFNIQAQDKNGTIVKVVYSENLTNAGYALIDFAVRSLFDQWGILYTYVGFISDKELPEIVVNFFDKEDNIFAQIDDCDKRVVNNEFKNLSYIYFCYLGHTDPSLIKTIVIEKRW